MQLELTLLMDGITLLKLNGTDEIEFPTVHANLWVLPGTLNREKLYFDLGVLVERHGATKPDSFEILLPFVAQESEFKDLSDSLHDANVVKLVFGHGSLLSDDQIEFFQDGKDRKHARIAKCSNRSRLERLVSGTRLRVVLAEAVADDPVVYLRVRFALNFQNTLWQHTTKRVGRQRCRFDFKFNDKRSVSGVDEPTDERFSECKEVNLYLVLPGNYESTTAAPEPSYTRTLEGSGWEKYVHRRIRFRESDRLVVHSWKFDDVSINAPARAYSTFAHYGEGWQFRQIAAASGWALAISLLVVLGNRHFESFDVLVSNATDSVSSLSSQVTTYIVGSGIIGVFTLRNRIAAVRSFFDWCRSAVHKAESALDRFRYRDENFR